MKMIIELTITGNMKPETVEEVREMIERIADQIKEDLKDRRVAYSFKMKFEDGA